MAASISPDGSKAAVVGMDDDHLMAVLDLNSGAVIAKQKGGKKIVLKIGWVSDNEFVSIGIRHYKYWTLDGAKLSAKDGKDPSNFVSLAVDSDKSVFVGASAGVINIYKGTAQLKSVQLKKP